MEQQRKISVTVSFSEKEIKNYFMNSENFVNIFKKLMERERSFDIIYTALPTKEYDRVTIVMRGINEK